MASGEKWGLNVWLREKSRPRTARSRRLVEVRLCVASLADGSVRAQLRLQTTSQRADEARAAEAATLPGHAPMHTSGVLVSGGGIAPCHKCGDLVGPIGLCLCKGQYVV